MSNLWHVSQGAGGTALGCQLGALPFIVFFLNNAVRTVDLSHNPITRHSKLYAVFGIHPNLSGQGLWSYRVPSYERSEQLVDPPRTKVSIMLPLVFKSFMLHSIAQ
jgi:hypothetical protein